MVDASEVERLPEALRQQAGAGVLPAHLMKLFTAAEVALAIGCDESTIRRQAARAWNSNGCPAPLAKHPSWRVVKRSAPEGGQGCGWLLARSEEAAIQAEPTREQAVALYSEVMALHECQTLGDMAEHFARAVLARWGNCPTTSQD